MKKFIIAALGVALGLASLNASAAIVSDSIAPSLLVTATCSIANSVGGQFPTQITGAGNADVNMAGGVITVTCPTGVVYKLGATIGTHSASTAQRQLLKNSGSLAVPADVIAYELFFGSQGGTLWGDAGLNAIDPSYTETTASTLAATGGTGDGSAQPYNIYGTAHFLAINAAGTFTDTVAVKVAF